MSQASGRDPALPSVDRPRSCSAHRVPTPRGHSLQKTLGTRGVSTDLRQREPHPAEGLTAVLFLDVDGVLHPVQARHPRQQFSTNCLALVAEVVKATGASICLSTAWRLDPSICRGKAARSWVGSSSGTYAKPRSVPPQSGDPRMGHEVQTIYLGGIGRLAPERGGFEDARSLCAVSTTFWIAARYGAACCGTVQSTTAAPEEPLIMCIRQHTSLPRRSLVAVSRADGFGGSRRQRHTFFQLYGELFPLLGAKGIANLATSSFLLHNVFGWRCVICFLLSNPE